MLKMAKKTMNSLECIYYKNIFNREIKKSKYKKVCKTCVLMLTIIFWFRLSTIRGSELSAEYLKDS